MKLNLGCCDRHDIGFVNVDRCPPADVIADLSQAWPWPDDSVSYIRAHDLIEHLPNKQHTMNEAWRVLRDGGVFDIIVPTTDGRGADQDPTHCSYWNRNSFFYYTHGDPHRERFGRHYGVNARFRVVSANEEMLADNVTKLSIKLAAVKQ